MGFKAFSGGLIIIFITQLDWDGVWRLGIAEERFGCEERRWGSRSVLHLFLLAWKSREFAYFVEGFQEGILVWKSMGNSQHHWCKVGQISWREA